MTVSLHSLLLLLPLVAAAVPATAAAASWFVSPGGSGDACTSAQPCALDAGMSKAGPGDEVVLKDGTYKTRQLATKRDGAPGKPITIRAENRHQAVVEYLLGGGQPPNKTVVAIRHSHIVLRGLVVDGMGSMSHNYGTGAIRLGHSGSVHRQIGHIVIEDNIARRTGHGANLGIFGVHDVIIRHNVFDGGGYYNPGPLGETAYFGGSSAKEVQTRVVNAEIYGNVFRNFMEDAIDFKGHTRNFKVHHNIFEDQASKTKDRGVTQHNKANSKGRGGGANSPTTPCWPSRGGTWKCTTTSSGAVTSTATTTRWAKPSARTWRSRGMGATGSTTTW